MIRKSAHGVDRAAIHNVTRLHVADKADPHQRREFDVLANLAAFATRSLIPFACALLVPAACYAQPKCDTIERELDKQSKLAENLVARERAAIEDLKNPKLEELYARMLRGWGPEKYFEERSNWDLTLSCLKEEAELKYYKIGVSEEKQLIENGCQRNKVSSWRLEQVKQRQEWVAKKCGKVDPAYYAQTVRQLDEIKAYKLANEEKPSPTVKQADASAADSPFCKQVKSISALAANGFKPIIGPRKPDNMFSSHLQTDSFSASSRLAFDSLSASPDCEVMIGNEREPDIQLRMRPDYSCTWNYERTSRKQLEERVDKLLNAARGCFSKIEEQATDDGFKRHWFIADASVDVSGTAYYGEGKPSHIRMSISKYAPDEAMACIRWKNGSGKDKALCEKAFK
ncbi:hypothetical protein [Bradyrhizobium sp. PRIMUS42]|uniref:hypothetical protein n=1 Tax=Bradyrhizobium sp. PRIMUS42 TaxID=2908926 RepID=UPI001FF44523|nr:hypothetical protein [Bradyrhizobium sp. PRIMUS42]MCJ9732928.1 hypothetical protein [Bradyrhizobium sp. PRIMUS42]